MSIEMINDTYVIDINSITKARKLNEIALTYEEDIDILKDRYVIDAKSILGIFSLDISQPLKIRIHTDNEDVLFRFYKDLLDLIVR